MHQSFNYIPKWYTYGHHSKIRINNQARFCILFHSYVSPVVLSSIENTMSENDNALSKII